MKGQTTHPKTEQIVRSWHQVDADGQVLGRLASRIATLLRGKHKSFYSPHVDCGDFVVITNAKKVRLTGKKLTQKFHYRHSMYPGGFKAFRYDRLVQEKPELVFEKAIYRMLPSNKLRDRQILRLKVYAGAEHPHSAQMPQSLSVN